MFRSASATTALLIIAEGLVLGLALPTTTSETLDKLSCVFSVSSSDGTSLEYNLCPLLERKQYRISREVETPPSRTKIYYDVNLQQNLAWDGTLPARDQCEEGTNICMIVVSERPDHRLEPPRTTYVVPVAGNIQDRPLNITSKIASQIDGSGHAPLKVTFHGGLYMGIPQEAIFTFKCDPTVNEPSEPVLTSHADPLEDQGKHKLSWTSRHACPIGGYPKPPTLSPSLPPITTPEPNSTSNILQTSLIIFTIAALGLTAIRWLKRHRSKHAPNRYRSLALSHITSALHHEADSRSPLSPHTPNSDQAKRYSSM